VLAAHRGRRQAARLGLTQDPDDLLFLEPRLAHRISSTREILSQPLVRKTQSTSSLLERGLRNPSLEVVQAVARGLGTTMASLVGELE
jgi:hypothetical protein